MICTGQRSTASRVQSFRSAGGLPCPISPLNLNFSITWLNESSGFCSKKPGQVSQQDPQLMQVGRSMITFTIFLLLVLVDSNQRQGFCNCIIPVFSQTDLFLPHTPGRPSHQAMHQIPLREEFLLLDLLSLGRRCIHKPDTRMTPSAPVILSPYLLLSSCVSGDRTRLFLHASHHVRQQLSLTARDGGSRRPSR
jgi:hypothetical protein